MPPKGCQTLAQDDENSAPVEGKGGSSLFSVQLSESRLSGPWVLPRENGSCQPPTKLVAIKWGHVCERIWNSCCTNAHVIGTFQPPVLSLLPSNVLQLTLVLWTPCSERCHHASRRDRPLGPSCACPLLEILLAKAIAWFLILCHSP